MIYCKKCDQGYYIDTILILIAPNIQLIISKFFQINKRLKCIIFINNIYILIYIYVYFFMKYLFKNELKYFTE